MKKETGYFYCVELKNGNTAFIYKGLIVNNLWDNFFANLSMEEERRSSELFVKKYGKRLDKINKLLEEMDKEKELNQELKKLIKELFDGGEEEIIANTKKELEKCPRR